MTFVSLKMCYTLQVDLMTFVSLKMCHTLQVDLMTFVSLTDEDLKELGVSTFGARKKMMNAMKGTPTGYYYLIRTLFSRANVH